MKHQLATRTLFIYFFALLIVFISGCDKDDDVGTSQPEQEYDRLIQLDVSTPFSHYDNVFVMATDETGHVHFDAVFTSLDTSFAIPIVGDHRIDITVGYKHTLGYNVNTYIDVADQFDNGIPSFRSCENELFDDIFNDRIDIEVENISFEEVVQSGMWLSANALVEVTANNFVLKDIFTAKDHLNPDRLNHLLCLKDTRYAQPRCMTVNSEDINDGIISLDYNDFFIPELRTIQVNSFIPENFKVKVRNGDKTLFLAQRNAPIFDGTYGEIDVYAPSGLNTDETLVEGTGGTLSGQSEVTFRRQGPGWPQSLEFDQASLVDLKLEADSAYASFEQQQDLIEIEMQFLTSNYIVTTINAQEIGHAIPEFSSRINSRFPDLANQLRNSIGVTATSYNSDAREIKEFRTPNARFQFQCEDYDAHRIATN